MRVQVVKVAEKSVPVTYTTPPLCEPEKKKRKRGTGKEENKEEEKDNVNVKDLSKIRNSIWLTHLTRILGETTAVKDGSTTASNICHPATL